MIKKVKIPLLIVVLIILYKLYDINFSHTYAIIHTKEHISEVQTILELYGADNIKTEISPVSEYPQKYGTEFKMNILKYEILRHTTKYWIYKIR